VRHLGQVAATLKAIVRLQKIIGDNRMAPLAESAGWQRSERISRQNCCSFLRRRVLTENLPPLLDSRRFVKPGYMPLLDEFIELSQNAVKHLTDYEERQKAEHQINTLAREAQQRARVLHRNFERARRTKRPKHYARRQTLTNAERYTTAELKELETKILSAEEEVLRIQKGVSSKTFAARCSPPPTS
jgi:DNA mismatch repair protein MutS